MKKYYAVRNGFHIGIYESWDDCKREVSGFSGAEYKSFKTRAEAVEYISGGTESAGSNEPVTIPPASADGAVAYCDGSFDLATRRYSYGLVIFCNNEIHRFSQAFDDAENAAMRNVAGEIEGAKAAMRYCDENGIKNLTLYYDYAGIEKWCTGEWKTNKAGTMLYARFYDDIKERVNVSFRKVKGHSGDVYNDEADALAKSALGI
ncbi:MAG: ribonuclease H family protein [Firmicutes bacterium]|nr:ribonuclease H family protein [Bacillota bacterium]